MIITRGFGSDQMIVAQGYGGTSVVISDLYFRGSPDVCDPLNSIIGYE